MARVIDDPHVQSANHIPFHRTLTEIESAYAVTSAPTVDGSLELIVRRPDVFEREVVDVGELTLADGLVGDSWRVRPLEETPEGKWDPLRQLTMISARTLFAIAGPVERWPLSGDQLVVDLDLSFDNLPTGTRLRVGAAEVEVTDAPHQTCKKFSVRFGVEAVRFVSTEDGRRRRLRGLNARVTRPGSIRRGDPVRKF
jgi:hypothetical protein